MTQFRYRAFISYSWADAKWGNWLHHKLETYRTPAALVGKEGALGPVPARLHPLFKDREEEAAGASIGTAVEAALASSEFLIVICSPNSAQSKWVEHEIAWFKAHRDPGKVLALIVDGEPGSADTECFPQALTHEVGQDLAITDPLADAPLAADARITGDGKRRAVLKLAAAMLGLGLDELVNRDERRRTIRARIVVAASLALALVMSGLAWVAVQARIEAEFQRNEADGLVEFMLTDLRERLEPVGRLDALDVVGERALAYYAGQRPGSLDADALGRRARALLLVGEISNLRGDSDDALLAFREAAETTQEQLARDPDNAQRVYDHAQSVFWVGYIAYSRGELEDAEAQFREYQRLATRLVEIDPDNPEWQMESSYAETNMGVMLQEQRRYAEAEPAFATGLARIEAVAASEEYDAGRQIEIGTTVNWLGLAKDMLGKDREALALFRREVELYREVLRRDPGNAAARNRLSVAWQFVGGKLLDSGEIAQAIDAVDRSLELNAELRALEPENTEWRETDIRARLNKSEYLQYAGRLSESRSVLDETANRLDRLIATDPTNTIWTRDLRRSTILASAKLELERGNTDRAQQLSRQAMALVATDSGADDSSRASRTRWVAGDVQMRLGRPAQARELWQAALAGLAPSPGLDGDRYILLRRLGQDEQAARTAAALDRRGYRHPAYLRARGR